MAVEHEKSDQVVAAEANHWSPHKGANLPVEIIPFKHVQATAGDANSLVDLVRLPPGKVRVLKMTHSRLSYTALGSGTTMDIGHTAYVDLDGSTVAAAVDALKDGLNVAADGSSDFSSANPPHIDSESRDGVLIQAKALGEGIPANAVLEGFVVIARLPQ